MALNRALARLADWAFWGAIVLVLALPVVTLPVAIAAGIAAATHGGFVPALRAASSTTRHAWIRGSMAGALLTVLTAWGLLLVTIDFGAEGRTEGALSRGIGTALIAAAVFAAPFIACALTGRSSARRWARSARRLAVLAPLRGLAHVGLSMIAVAAAALFPVLVVPVLGAVVANAAAIPASAARRLERAGADLTRAPGARP